MPVNIGLQPFNAYQRNQLTSALCQTSTISQHLEAPDIASSNDATGGWMREMGA
jgi:hypothetical protein